MIYILEDDASILKLISYTLNKEGKETKGFTRPSLLFKELEQNDEVDLILLDIMLPEMDGIEVLKRLKKDNRYNKIPIIMLTAKSSEYDKVLGLDEGADDYITKPFGIMELVARINAVIRRYEKFSNNKVMQYKALTVDYEAHLVKVNDNKINLTRKEFDLLCTLMSHIDKVYTREELIERVWGYDFVDSSRTVDVHIRTLRSKLLEAKDYIKTVRTIGYKIGEDL